MSAHRLVSDLHQLEGRRDHRTEYTRQFLFHRGRKTFYCIPQAMSVNHPLDVEKLQTTSYGFETGTTDTAVYGAESDLTDYYLWGNESSMRVCNRSVLPVYVKVWFVQARRQIPVSMDTNDWTKYDKKWVMGNSINSSGSASFLIDMLYEGIKKKTLDSNEGGNNFFTTDQANQGRIAADGEIYDLGEGLGAVTSAGTAVQWLESAQNSRGSEYGLATPLQYKLHDSHEFCSNFNIYHCKKFMINPECFAEVKLSEKSLKVIGFEQDMNYWNYLETLANPMTKFMIIEVEGSITSANVFENDAGTALTADDDVISTGNNYNIFPALEHVSTHEGAIALVISRKFSGGYFSHLQVGDQIVAMPYEDTFEASGYKRGEILGHDQEQH